MTRRAHIQRALSGARIYLVMDASFQLAPVEVFITAAVEGGVGVVQLREKTLSDSALLKLAERCATACRNLRIPFIVNDRVDIAVACGADGVHVGQDDLPVQAVREVAGDSLIVGLSTHSSDQIDAANTSDIDYIGVGPIHETPTKEGRRGVGTGLIRYAALHARVPFFAIGGLEPGNLAEAVAAGATRVSVRRWILHAADPRSATRSLLEAYDRARGVSAR